MRSNPRTFFKLDKINHNGQVEWTEWLNHFQKEHNIVDVEFKHLKRGLKEKLAAAKAAWSEAARSNPDALNIGQVCHQILQAVNWPIGGAVLYILIAD